jgi:hypothetical protein
MIDELIEKTEKDSKVASEILALIVKYDYTIQGAMDVLEKVKDFVFLNRVAYPLTDETAFIGI